MTVERVSQGIRITSTTNDDHLFTRLYIGYTLREAKRLFRAELREENERSR